MKKIILIFIIVIALALTGYAQITVGGITFSEINFFETGDSYPDKDNRSYSEEFDRSKVRYIACELDIINELYDDYDRTYDLVCKYYYPDGSLFGEIKDDFSVKSEWYTSWYTNSWGWDEPGNWQGGEYTVEVFINGSFFGKKTFKIYNDEPVLVYDGVSLFEGGNTAPPQDQRTYESTFSQDRTRYIWTELQFDNYFYDIEDQLVMFKVKFYYPSGDFMGDLSFDYLVPADWESGSVWKGYGWGNPGNWDKGKYRIVIYFGNDNVGETYFTIE